MIKELDICCFCLAASILIFKQDLKKLIFKSKLEKIELSCLQLVDGTMQKTKELEYISLLFYQDLLPLTKKAKEMIKRVGIKQILDELYK